MSHNTQSAPSYVDPLEKVVEAANAALRIGPGDRLKAKTKIRERIREDYFRQYLENNAETAKEVLLEHMNRPGDLTDILLGHVERLMEALKPKNVDISKLSEIYKDINSAFHDNPIPEGGDGELREQQENNIKEYIFVPLSSPKKGNQRQKGTEWWPQPSLEESAAPSYPPYRDVATDNDLDTEKNVRRYFGPPGPSVLSARTEDDQRGNQSTRHETDVSRRQERGESTYGVPPGTQSGGVDEASSRTVATQSSLPPPTSISGFIPAFRQSKEKSKKRLPGRQGSLVEAALARNERRRKLQAEKQAATSKRVTSSTGDSNANISERASAT